MARHFQVGGREGETKNRKQKTKGGGAGAQPSESVPVEEKIGARPSESVPVEEKIRNVDQNFLKVGSRTKFLRMVL